MLFVQPRLLFSFEVGILLAADLCASVLQSSIAHICTTCPHVPESILPQFLSTWLTHILIYLNILQQPAL